jgi:D-psicose/D-tagatose/L-ribulose 3-epimerase
MTKVGFNVLVWSAMVSDQLKPIVDRLKTIGYDGVECLLANQDRSDYQKFGQHVHDLGMEATCVFVLSKDQNPIDPSAKVRSKGLDQIKYNIDCAHSMQAKLICGPFHSAHGHFMEHAPEDREYGWAAEVLHAAGEHAAQADIILAPEALNRFECYLCNTMEQLLRLVKEVDHPNVRAMFDTHHANVEEKKLSGAIRSISPVLAHVHISENDRGTPGDGHVPFDEVFSTLADIGYEGWLTIEAFSRNDPAFANAIGVWREFSKPWDIAEKGYAFIKKMQKKYGMDAPELSTKA